MGVNNVEAAGIDAVAPPKHLSTNGDVKCEVLVEDEAAEAYGVERKEKEVSGYIVSEENKHFAIRVHDERKNPTNSLICRLRIDGIAIGKTYFDSTKARRSFTFMGPRIDANSRAPFLFSPVKVTDDVAESNNSPDFLNGVGTIRIELHRVDSQKGDRMKARKIPDVLQQQRKVVHETSKKGMLSHTAGLDAARPAKSPKAHKARTDTYLDGRDQPSHTFNFYYRSRDLLELQSIIPAEQVDIVEEVPDEKPAVAGPGPKSKSKKREVIVLDSDEEEEGRDAELERLRREVAAYKKVKLEEKGTSSSAVKQEEGKGKDRVVIDISD